MATPPSTFWLRFRIIYSLIGLTIGLSVLAVFGFNFQNWNAALWGLASGLAAGLTCYLHIAYKRKVWQTYPYRLRYWMISGCFIQLAGVVGFAVYLALAISLKQGLIVHGNGFYLTCVWCFMTWKWGFSVFHFSRTYKRLYYDEYTIIPDDDCQMIYIPVYSSQLMFSPDRYHITYTRLAAGLTCYLHIAYKRKVWQTYPYRLRYWMISGCFIQLAGVVGFAVYLALAISLKQGLIVHGNGFYLTCVWCFMTWKWGFSVFHFSRTYKRLYYDEYTIIPDDDCQMVK
ncbi:hypothetical protein KUTeg_015180 [Tegillarca granosa]|uniref:Uncharacterized protein n=1 Tax=Tegillarca granosa TaxID=220873 RepID=A0ABQ9ERU9_TEGGR|nr:hypothetical protein KUTeg_015180 [Tegillarca granosa]